MTKDMTKEQINQFLDILKSQLPKEDETFRLGVRANIPLLALSLPSHITPRSLAQQALRAVGETSGLHEASHPVVRSTPRLAHPPAGRMTRSFNTSRS